MNNLSPVVLVWNSRSQKRHQQTASSRATCKVLSCVPVWCPAGGEGYRVTAQMVLVCCWRSMKEVAMLLGQLCHSLPLHSTQDLSHTHQGLITRAQVRAETTVTHTQTAGSLSTLWSYTRNQSVCLQCFWILILLMATINQWHHFFSYANVSMWNYREKTFSQFRVPQWH